MGGLTHLQSPPFWASHKKEKDNSYFFTGVLNIVSIFRPANTNHNKEHGRTRQKNFCENFCSFLFILITRAGNIICSQNLATFLHEILAHRHFWLIFFLMQMYTKQNWWEHISAHGLNIKISPWLEQIKNFRCEMKCVYFWQGKGQNNSILTHFYLNKLKHNVLS